MGELTGVPGIMIRCVNKEITSDVSLLINICFPDSVFRSATTDSDPNQTVGSGRRMCPGLNVAERSLYLGIVRLVWAFNITKAKDVDGNEIPIDRDAIEVSQSACPKPFQ